MLILPFYLVGHDTKVMKNARAAHHKLSHLETRMSRTVVFVFFIQVLLCAIAACVHHFYFNSSVLQHVGDDHSASQKSVLLFLSFVVLMNTLIPISLVVTVEIIKTVHAKFITWDSKMRNTNGEGAMANTSTLTDELGQVKYIFTDKTGTLTQNQMVFRKCSVGGGVYVAKQKRSLLSGVSISSLDALGTGSIRPTTFHRDDAQPNEPLTVSYFRRLLKNLDSRESHFALAMSLCHTVVCEYDRSTGALSYNSDSPDECALVRGAESMGVRLLERCGQKLYVAITEEDRHGSHVKTVTYTLTFQILRVVHFSSDRKRMTIIVRDENGGIKLFCKGADSVILERCDHFMSNKDETMAHVTQFAEEGYRILLFAERDLVR